MPGSHEPIRRRHMEIVLIVLLPPCVRPFHRHHLAWHRAHRPAAADDLADPVDTVDRVDRVVGRGAAEVGSIIRVA